MTQREFVGLVVGICISGWAHAQVTVEEPWIRATAPGQTVAGGYMSLRSAKPSALVEVSTPLTARAEIHEMSMEAGVMKMRAVPKIDLPAGKTVELKPGGYHVMLMNLDRPLRDGETVFLAGDTSYTEAHMLAGTVDGVAPDVESARLTLARIRELAGTRRLVYLPSHDPDSGTRLAGLVPVGETVEPGAPESVVEGARRA